MRRTSIVSSLALVAAVWSAGASSSLAEESTIFRKPVRLQADGQDVDAGPSWGHAGPALADVDGDGLGDLVVGDFSGKFRVFRNVGSHKEPKFAAPTFLMAGDEEAKVPIYCCIGSSPCFVDFDGDGMLDMISGSYDPGECYLFRGVGQTKFAARETLVDKSGKPIVRKPDQQQRYQSFGSWPAMVDWDNDGDLDLVVGGFDGTIMVRLNEGSRQKPVFSDSKVVVESDGKELQLPDTRHAAVAIADWDQDGRWDLLSGSDSGAVFFYKNAGEPGKPVFGAAEVLIPKHQGSGYDEMLEVGAEPAPGIRTQIAACDYNADGKVDLLVGDFCTYLTPKPGLTSADRDAMKGLFAQIAEAGEARGKIFNALSEDFKKRYPGDAINSDKASAEWSKAYRAMHDSKEYKALDNRDQELNRSLEKYLVKPAIPDSINEMATCHGYVWLFLRK